MWLAWTYPSSWTLQWTFHKFPMKSSPSATLRPSVFGLKSPMRQMTTHSLTMSARKLSSWLTLAYSSLYAVCTPFAWSKQTRGNGLGNKVTGT